MSIESPAERKEVSESTGPTEEHIEELPVSPPVRPDSAETQTADRKEEQRLNELEELRKRLGMTPLLHVKDVPLSATAEEILKRKMGMQPSTFAESMRAGRDEVYFNYDIPGMHIRPDHAYRAVRKETLEKYVRTGSVEGDLDKPDIFVPGENNAGVDWYLGGVAPKYGDFVLETPARPEFFSVADQDKDSLMAKDVFVRHAKSEGGTEKSIPMSDVMVYELIRSEEGMIAKPVATESLLTEGS